MNIPTTSRAVLLGSIFLSFVSDPGYGQNLVPNPDLEDHVLCPDNSDQVDRCTDWTSYGNSSDYFNTCFTPPPFNGVDVPGNFAGYQQAHSGVAYCGIITYDELSPGYTEFIGAALTQPLVIGATYYVKFYVSHAGNPGFRNATNNQGVLFTTSAYSNSNPPPQDNFAHVNNTAVITDSVDWTLTSGSFVADSAYTHIAIGNFFDLGGTDIWNLGSLTTDWAYYYIDDVCVSPDPFYCDLSTGIVPVSAGPVVSFNVLDRMLNVDVRDGKSWSIFIHDASGRLLTRTTCTGSTKVPLVGYAPGVLFYALADGHGGRHAGRFVVP